MFSNQRFHEQLTQTILKVGTTLCMCVCGGAWRMDCVCLVLQIVLYPNLSLHDDDMDANKHIDMTLISRAKCAKYDMGVFIPAGGFVWFITEPSNKKIFFRKVSEPKMRAWYNDLLILTIELVWSRSQVYFFFFIFPPF